jgi:hypothetical protein
MKTILHFFAMLSLVGGFFLGIAEHRIVWSGVCFFVAGALQIPAGRHFSIGLLFGLVVISSALDTRVPFWIVSGIGIVVALDEFRQLLWLMLGSDRSASQTPALFQIESDIAVRMWNRLMRTHHERCVTASNGARETTRR